MRAIFSRPISVGISENIRARRSSLAWTYKKNIPKRTINRDPTPTIRMESTWTHSVSVTREEKFQKYRPDGSGVGEPFGAIDFRRYGRLDLVSVEHLTRLSFLRLRVFFPK
ncbi:uncharacterized protein LOC143199801 [Rhynchophorus ferrugineus]|uniref:uncharacterized protein LOC143199801 n=1 Tax=Rhynchophorus ferrugineus TaxID=354439 RepID=UPI003FCC606F